MPPNKSEPAAPTRKTKAPKPRSSGKSEIAEVIAEETSNIRIPNGTRRSWVDDDLHITHRRERHDHGYVPRGHLMVDGRLYPEEREEPPMTPDDRELVEAVIFALKRCLDNNEFTPNDRTACLALLESLFGHPVGESWRSQLANLLREEAQRREQERIARGGVVARHGELRLRPRFIQIKLNGARGEWPPARTPHEILKLVRQRTPGETVPEFLSEDVIEQALTMVNLGGGGGRGKKGGRTPEQCVQWIAAQGQRVPRKPRP